MDSDGAQTTIGFVGGTGPLGRGLAVRLARAGHRVLLGSRDEGKAAAAVEKLGERAAGTDLVGVTNERACADADVAFVTIPYTGQRQALPALAGPLGGKVVVCCVNAIEVDDRGPKVVRVPAGSAAEECQDLLARSRVAAAFHTVPARLLLDVGNQADCDTFVFADDEPARKAAFELATDIPGMRAIDAGPLRLSVGAEAATAVLLAVNLRYGTRAHLRVEDLER
jgi:8-hydroxy-5-deazaflavin:NADPH oxidoreductase